MPDGIAYKAKVRWILQGYKDPDVLEVDGARCYSAIAVHQLSSDDRLFLPMATLPERFQGKPSYNL